MGSAVANLCYVFICFFMIFSCCFICTQTVIELKEFLQPVSCTMLWIVLWGHLWDTQATCTPWMYFFWFLGGKLVVAIYNLCNSFHKRLISEGVPKSLNLKYHSSLHVHTIAVLFYVIILREIF